MITSTSFLVILLVTCTPAKSEQFNNFSGNIAKERQRRTSSLAKIGLDALENLLEGTTKLQSQSRRHRRFEKNGDLRTAEKDFFSVNPRNVRNYSGQYGHTMGKVMVGDVGDRHLLLNSVGYKGKPILEVIDTTFKPGQYVDRIIYKKPSN